MNVLERIQRAGVVVLLPGDIPWQRIVPIGDALLAAPIQAVQVLANSPHAVRVISDLRQRGGEHLLVGAGDVQTEAEVDALVDAGAQFVHSSRLTQALYRRCQAREVLYLPGVISLFAVQMAQELGCDIVQLTTGGPSGPDFVRVVRQAVPDVAVMVAGDVTAVNAAAYSLAGAVAVAVAEPIYTGSDQPMTDIITQARRLQRAWEAGEP